MSTLNTCTCTHTVATCTCRFTHSWMTFNAKSACSLAKYCKSRIFHVKSISCDKFSCLTDKRTPYRFSINNAHNFHAFNFCIAHSIRKYFNNKRFHDLRYTKYSNMKIYIYFSKFSFIFIVNGSYENASELLMLMW